MDLAALRDDFSVKRVYRSKGEKVYRSTTLSKTIPVILGALAVPIVVTADTFTDIHSTIMGIFDGGVVIVIIFAGAAWALGHRSKAIELLIGAACGYLLARHAIEIRDYLKSIGA